MRMNLFFPTLKKNVFGLFLHSKSYFLSRWEGLRLSPLEGLRTSKPQQQLRPKLRRRPSLNRPWEGIGGVHCEGEKVVILHRGGEQLVEKSKAVYLPCVVMVNLVL